MAREYGRIKTAFWTSRDLRDLPRGVRETAAYLLTGPHTTALGCFRLPLGYVAEDMGLSIEEVRADIAALTERGWLVYDEKEKFVWIKKFLAHNEPENEKVWIHVGTLLKGLPTTFSAFNAVLDTVPIPYRKCIERVSEPYRSPEPEPEPEPDPEESVGVASAAQPSGDIDPDLVSRPKAVRGTRWPADAVIPDDWLKDAAELRVSKRLPAINLRLEAEKFANYWASKAGGAATKTDWRRTWINWVLTAKGAQNAQNRATYDDAGSFEDAFNRLSERSRAAAE